MRYFTRVNGSQRQSQSYRVETFVTLPTDDGATHYPILYVRVENKWHMIEFENESEARVLLSCAQHIYRSFGKPATTPER